jgi:hypothetical protein
MTMRASAFLLTGLFCVLLACGCGSDSANKGINKDRDRPVPQEPAKPRAPR